MFVKYGFKLTGARVERRTVETQHPTSHRSQSIESAVSSNKLLEADEKIDMGIQRILI